jgi:nucleotide-binding universal stress UspA family protein
MASPYVIVVGVDYSKNGDQAVMRALELAAQQPLAEVHLVNVARSYGAMVHVDLAADTRTLSAGDAIGELEQYAKRQMAEFSPASFGGLKRIVTHLRVDAPATEIAQLASDLEADLVVVGTHGRRGFSRVLLGSVAEAVVRLAPCPVLVVRPKGLGEVLPRIEPPCPRCVEERAKSQGKELWCEQHRERHGPRHTYHQVDRNVDERPFTGLLTSVR